MNILKLDEEIVKVIIKQYVERNYGTVIDVRPEVGIYDYGDYAEFEGVTVLWEKSKDA